MQNWLDIVRTDGLAILIALLVISGSVLTWLIVYKSLSKLLLGDDGLISKVANSVIGFFDTARENSNVSVQMLETQQSYCSRHGRSISELARDNHHMALAGMRACDVAEQTCETLGIKNPKEHIQPIRKELDKILNRLRDTPT